MGSCAPPPFISTACTQCAQRIITRTPLRRAFYRQLRLRLSTADTDLDMDHDRPLELPLLIIHDEAAPTSFADREHEGRTDVHS